MTLSTRHLRLVTALLFAISSVGQVYAATAASMQMPMAPMEQSAADHDMDCAGGDKAGQAACVATCATAVAAILSEPTAIPFRAVVENVEPAAQLPLTSRAPSPDLHPPKI